MATLDFLKRALRRDYPDLNTQMQKQPMSDANYSEGFATLMQGAGSGMHQEHIVGQLSNLLNHNFNGRQTVSILEVGPGPRSVLSQLPYDFRRKIRRYTALEPNHIFAANLQDWLHSTTENPLPCLQSRADILCRSFDLGRMSSSHTHTDKTTHKYDIVLFCHSMYGMNPKRSYIEQALSMLNSNGDEMVIVIHRNNSLRLDGLVTHRTISLPSGKVKVRNNDASLDTFALFIAGCGAGVDDATRVKWRTACRVLGGRDKAHPGHLVFDTPDSLMAFNHHATALPRLLAKVPAAPDKSTIKNDQARHYRPAGIVRPTSPEHIQECVQWAIDCKVGLTIVAGSHSGQCIWPNVVAVDMSAFNQVHVVACDDQNAKGEINPCKLVVAEAGCTTESIVRRALEEGTTVPLGARPSVGVGLPLQGGIGHLARSHGLACDSIVGAVMVSLDTGKILCVGIVPKEHQPVGSLRPKNEDDILWGLKGAGTNIGVVLSVVFKTCAAPTFAVRNWVLPLSSNNVARNRLQEFENAAKSIEKICSADAYLYLENGHLSLGVTTFEPAENNLSLSPPESNQLEKAFGRAQTAELMDAIEVFDAEMYMSGMHGGHGGGKTSSFKRCIFLKGIGNPIVAARLVSAVESRPSPMCYLHLLHGGGAVSGVQADATAFGCRDWDFACVITGVWSRALAGGVEERSAIKWVYEVANDLLPISSGAYGADLGPDPRDIDLATRAFGSNGARLARLKAAMDPHHVLVYACPLPKQHNAPRLIVLVTGQCRAGKDFCGEVWQATFAQSLDRDLTAKVVSISDATKREYAAHTGADLERLLGDREYKERHRQALTTFFQNQIQERPQLPQEHFLNAVHSAVDVDVLLITGMRDVAPVATLSHLVPESRLVEVQVQRRAACGNDMLGTGIFGSSLNEASWKPTHTFDNDINGTEAARAFAHRHLIPLVDQNIQRLSSMIRTIPHFPRAGVEFRHVLGLAQQVGGLALCASLLRSHFALDWKTIGLVVGCEAGGFIFASALATQTNMPLVLIRNGGKLPAPVISVAKPLSHISTLCKVDDKRLEMERDAITRGASVVVVDDVLASGATLCAVLHLLSKAGVSVENVSIMVIAEFPAHRGRYLLQRSGFGEVNVQSLLVMSGV